MGVVNVAATRISTMEFKVVPPLILVAELIIAFILALCLLHRYGNIKRMNPFVTISTLTVWFLSFAIIVLLPIDVSSVSNVNNACNDYSLAAMIIHFSFILGILSYMFGHQDSYYRDR